MRELAESECECSLSPYALLYLACPSKAPDSLLAFNSSIPASFDVQALQMIETYSL